MISSLWKGRFCEENNVPPVSPADSSNSENCILQKNCRCSPCKNPPDSCADQKLPARSQRAIPARPTPRQSPGGRAARAGAVPAWGEAPRGRAPPLCTGPRSGRPGRSRSPTGPPALPLNGRRRHDPQAFNYSSLGTTGKPTTDLSPWDAFSVAKKQQKYVLLWGLFPCLSGRFAILPLPSAHPLPPSKPAPLRRAKPGSRAADARFFMCLTPSLGRSQRVGPSGCPEPGPVSGGSWGSRPSASPAEAGRRELGRPGLLILQN